MIDVSKIKAGKWVKLDDGTEGEVKGSYLSVDGIVLRVVKQPGSIVAQNVPIGRVTEVGDASGIRETTAVHGGGTGAEAGGEANTDEDVVEAT